MATKKWSAKVNTDSTHPDEGLFKNSAAEIASALASKKVSPKGPASGMRMLNFYINRAGKNLSASRQGVLESAKTKLSEIIAKQKDEKPKPAPKKSAAKKAPARKSAKKAATKKTAKKTTKKTASKRSTP